MIYPCVKPSRLVFPVSCCLLAFGTFPRRLFGNTASLPTTSMSHLPTQGHMFGDGLEGGSGKHRQ